MAEDSAGRGGADFLHPERPPGQQQQHSLRGLSKTLFRHGGGWHAGAARTASPQIPSAGHPGRLAGAPFMARPAGVRGLPQG